MIALTPRIWLFLIILTAWATWRWLRARPHQGPGFRDAVKNPDLWTEMEDHFHDIQKAREQAKHWSEDEVALAVERYLFKILHSDDDDDLGQQLAQQPEVTARLVRETLRDTAMRTRLQKQKRGQMAWVRACMLLDNDPRAENAHFVRALLDDPNEDNRRDAWFWLAKIGTDDVVDELICGISEPDADWMRGSIISGLEWAEREGRLTATGKRGLFEPMLDNLDGYDTAAVPAFLLRWDRARAMQAFAERGLLDPAHDEFAYIAQAMADAGLSLPREQLLELLREGSEPYTTSTFYAFGKMLGTFRDPENEATLVDMLATGGSAAEAAAAGLQVFHGIADWSDQLAARRGDWTEHERRLDAMRWVENEVCNGGFTQYFFNSSGANWRAALAGFDEVGDTHRGDLLREAVGRFPKEPDTDRDRRMNQLAALETGDADDAFDDLDTRYYESRTDIDVILTRYMLAHREALTPNWQH